MTAKKYRMAHQALSKLDSEGSWRARFQTLLSLDLTHFGCTFDINEDLAKTMSKSERKEKNPKRKEALVKPGDGKKMLSWIWRVKGALGTGDDVKMVEGKALLCHLKDHD